MTGMQTQETSLTETVKDHPVTTTLVILTAALAGAVVALASGIFSTGEEVPIRVRSGSIYFEILDTSSSPTKWEKDTGNGEWRLSKGTRTKEDLQLDISQEGTGCSKDTATAKKIFLAYDDGFTIEIHGKNKHLRLKPDDLDKLKPNGDQTLEYGTAGSGLIKSIFLETKTSTPLCSFDGAANKLKHFSILDY